MAKVAVEGHRKDKLKHIDPKEINVGERFREDFGDIDELVASIREKGLIQPISIDSNNNLLAGGRRHRAVLLAGLPTIPVIVRDVVDELDAREIELFENLYRKDFTWVEKCKLLAEIDNLFRRKHGDENWSIRKTAEQVEQSKSAVARDLEMAGYLRVMPELSEMKTQDDAFKFMKKIGEGQIVAELRRRQEATMNGSSEQAETKAAATTALGQLANAIKATLRLAQSNYMIKDVFTGMKGLKDNGDIQIIECDPPYGIDLNDQKANKESVGSTVTGYHEIQRESYPDFLKRLCSELYRVAGKDCWLVFWFGPTWQREVFDALKDAGWAVDEIPAIWTKNQGQTLQPELYFARGYEPFYLCRKGKPVMVERGRLNVFSFPGVAGAKKYHPTQRPTALIEEIFQTLSAGNTHVFVPFLGSGATLLACYNLGFRGFGFDLNDEYKDKFMLAVEEQTRKNFDTDEAD